ncbi:hypothetical protein HY605_04175 [Candidatus Peregrinibacteria bacterium]|nr:hypothetical protein [Candidatus Peregrinibacteria bacterium]
MRSFDEERDSENTLPERRAEVDEEVQRAKFLQLYLQCKADETTDFIAVAGKFKGIIGDKGENLAHLLGKLNRDGSVWLYNLYCAYLLDNNRNAYQTAKDFGIHHTAVIRSCDRVNMIFQSD